MDHLVHALQSALFVITAYPYGVIWFLVWGGALVFYLFKKSPVIEKSKRKIFWISLACVPLFLVVISVSEIRTEYQFRKACAEDSGVFVYRKVSLGPEYWLEIDPAKGPSNDDTAYIVSSTIELNRPVFDRDFDFELDIVRLESGIARHSRVLKDLKSGKVLSEIKDYSAQIVYFMSQKNRKCRTVLGKDALPANVRLELISNTFTLVK